MNPEILLSDEFVEFSQKIAEIHARKKELKQAFESTYADYKSQIRQSDEQVAVLKQEFDTFVQERSSALEAKNKKSNKE